MTQKANDYKIFQKYNGFNIINCQCGYNPASNHMDNIYPANREKTKYNVCCTFHNGGCGRTVYGNTLQNAIERWNQGINDETIY